MKTLRIHGKVGPRHEALPALVTAHLAGEPCGELVFEINLSCRMAKPINEGG